MGPRPTATPTTIVIARTKHTHLLSSSSSLVSLVPLFFVALVITFRFGLPFLLFSIGYDDTIIDSVVSGRYPWRVNRLCSECPGSFSCSPWAACTLDGSTEHENWSTRTRIIAKWKINASIRSVAVFPTQIYSALYFWLCTQRTQEHQLNTDTMATFTVEGAWNVRTILSWPLSRSKRKRKVNPTENFSRISLVTKLCCFFPSFSLSLSSKSLRNSCSVGSFHSLV